MTGLRRALWALAAAGVACGLGGLALVFGSDFDHDKTTTLVFGPLIGWSFIGTGLYAWWRRPQNHFGFLIHLLMAFPEGRLQGRLANGIQATLRRAVLLPATMKLLGKWNWYLPKRLSWLPQVEPAPVVS